MTGSHVPWDEFYSALTSHVGEKRAVVIFCEETDFHESAVYLWRRQNRVPGDALIKIAEIPSADCDRDRFKGFHSQRFFRRVVELSNQNMPIKAISTILTTEFNRKVTIGAVKSARFRLKDQIPGYRTRGAPIEE